jgi:O-antigen/teichoic acid export membrane protein
VTTNTEGVATPSSRIRKTLGASFVGQLVNVASQLLLTPWMMFIWGLDFYGDWLVLSCIPAYLALADAGIAGAAGNQMAMESTRGATEAANITFHSAKRMLNASCLVLFSIACAVLIVLVPSDVLPLTISDVTSQRVSVILLVIATCVQQQINLYSSVYRCDGHFAKSCWINVWIRFAELIAQALFVFFSSIEVIAAIQVVVRLTGLIHLVRHSYSTLHWLEKGTLRADWSVATKLLSAGASFLLFPLGTALTMQGMLLIIAASLGGASVAVFNAHRTMLNSIIQLMSMINHSIWPEFSLAYGRKDIQACKLLHRKSCAISIWAASISICAIGITSYWTIPLWTLHKVQADLGLVISLSVVMLARVVWYTSSVIATATNQHHSLAILYATFALFVVLLAQITASPASSLASIAWNQLILEACMCVAVLRKSLAITCDRFQEYARYVMRPPLKELYRITGLTRGMG